jgi:hypothetical protein
MFHRKLKVMLIERMLFIFVATGIYIERLYFACVSGTDGNAKAKAMLSTE